VAPNPRDSVLRRDAGKNGHAGQDSARPTQPADAAHLYTLTAFGPAECIADRSRRCLGLNR
jgi:hypothetical protein